MELPFETVSSLVRYEKETGKLFWKKRTPDNFRSAHHSAKTACKIWNSRYAGKEAFTASDNNGYKRGSIFGLELKAHRVAWLLATGLWPSYQIDHVNGVKHDNRLSNLRDISAAENRKNQPKPKDNTSGQIGVVWDASRGQWQARVTSGRKTKFLGRFDHFADAVAARKVAQEAHGFHQNHGRSA